MTSSLFCYAMFCPTLSLLGGDLYSKTFGVSGWEMVTLLHLRPAELPSSPSSHFPELAINITTTLSLKISFPTHQGRGLLILCNGGRHRSIALCIALLCLRYHLTIFQADTCHSLATRIVYIIVFTPTVAILLHSNRLCNSASVGQPYFLLWNLLPAYPSIYVKLFLFQYLPKEALVQNARPIAQPAKLRSSASHSTVAVTSSNLTLLWIIIQVRQMGAPTSKWSLGSLLLSLLNNCCPT